MGNWTTCNDDGTSQARTHDEANQISTIATWHNPAFDAAGNMTEGPKPGSGATKQQYVYDTFGNAQATVGDLDDIRYQFTAQEYDPTTAPGGPRRELSGTIARPCTALHGHLWARISEAMKASD